jgi:hypothetical protein
MFRSALRLPDVLFDSRPALFFLQSPYSGDCHYNSRIFSKQIAKDIKLYKNIFFLIVQGNIKNREIRDAEPSIVVVNLRFVSQRLRVL